MGYFFNVFIASSFVTYRAFPTLTIPSANSSKNTDSVRFEFFCIALHTRSPTAHFFDS